MSIGTTKGEIIDIGVGGINNSQGIGEQDVETKIVESSLDLKGNMAVGILEYSSSEGG